MFPTSFLLFYFFFNNLPLFSNKVDGVLFLLL